MKIAFHLNNDNINAIDCRNITRGNPGIGGSEYAVISVVDLLSKRNNDLDVILFAQQSGLFPENVNVELAENLNLAIDKALKQQIRLMIVDFKYLDKSLVLKHKDAMNFIVWGHNFLSYRDYNFFQKQSNVLRIVHVGREQCDLYRDHSVFSKSDYIYNGIYMPTIDKYETVPFRDRNNNVIYVGSLVKVKGFLELAKVWKKVLSYVPDANLYVVGTGKLYGNNRMLGKWGIADTEYESQFIPYLLDENGNLLPSVHFMGIMGDEKNDLLLKCKVGVPNPTGISETFGFTAVEMQAMGCLVTTMRCPGYLDTVALNGILYKSTSKLAKSIITLLQQKDNDYQLMYNFIKSRFDYNIIISQWEKLLMDCGNNKMEYLHSLYPLSNPNYHGKRIKEFIRKWKKRIPVLQVVPPVEIFIDMIYRFFNRKFISFSWWCSFFRRYSRKINNKIMFKLHYKQ